jgi:hypothetical protein
MFRAEAGLAQEKRNGCGRKDFGKGSVGGAATAVYCVLALLQKPALYKTQPVIADSRSVWKRTADL